MCVAIPGLVIAMHGHVAEVDFNGNKVQAEAGLVQVQPGDRVLVHAGCIIQTLTPELADEMEQFYKDMQELQAEPV